VSETVLIPGGRDARHPRHRRERRRWRRHRERVPGRRGRRRLPAAPPTARPPRRRAPDRRQQRADRSGIDCLRFDYGDWDEGYGESTDADNTVGWAAVERYERVGLFGFSFGGDGRARHGGVPPRTRRGLRARADRATEPRRGRSCGPRRSYRSQRANADPVRDPRLDGRLGARGGAGQGVGNRDDRIRVRPLLRRAGR